MTQPRTTPRKPRRQRVDLDALARQGEREEAARSHQRAQEPLDQSALRRQLQMLEDYDANPIQPVAGYDPVRDPRYLAQQQQRQQIAAPAPRYDDEDEDDGYDADDEDDLDDEDDEDYAPPSRSSSSRPRIVNSEPEDDDDPLLNMPPMPTPQKVQHTGWLDLSHTVNKKGHHPYKRFAGWAIVCRTDLPLGFLEAIEQMQNEAEHAREESRRTGRRVPPKLNASVVSDLIRKSVYRWNFPLNRHEPMPQPHEGGTSYLDINPGPNGEPSLVNAIFDTVVQAISPKRIRSTR